MTDWTLPQLLAGLHEEIHRRLETVRNSLGHPGTKGDASERVWLELLQKYLPQRYQAAKAHVVDSKGAFSQQIDVVVFDRQYSPFIFRCEGQVIVPAESIYAAFEAKQSINATQISYTQEKIASVRRLYRTSLPIPHAGGIYKAKELTPILGGVLTLESDWNPPLGPALREALEKDIADGHLDLGCAAAHGHFALNRTTMSYDVMEGKRPATAFLFRLISDLQFSGTVPMIDIQAYAQWLAD